jgi:lipid-A-disaccharide synthase
LFTEFSPLRTPVLRSNPALFDPFDTRGTLEQVTPPQTVLVSAGEASGDRYAGLLVAELLRRRPNLKFFGCAGARLREAGVEPVVRGESLSVVGLVEVIHHIPRIYQEFRRLIQAARTRRPDLAILTDSPDFHFRVARKLRAMGVPVVYLVAPQVWAWRQGRTKVMRRIIDRLLCIFPFEEEFFRTRGVSAQYIGHPLAGRVRPFLSKPDFFRKHSLPLDRPLIAILPGSRQGEAARHLPVLMEVAARLNQETGATCILPASATTGVEFFRQRIAQVRAGAPVQVIDGESWDAMAHCDVALAASGTVTVEGALLGAPMVTYYRVNALSWLLGRRLVKVPFLSMVNLIAGRMVVKEFMQHKMTAANLAGETKRLLDRDAAAAMRRDLQEVARRLSGDRDAILQAADEVERLMNAGEV